MHILQTNIIYIQLPSQNFDDDDDDDDSDINYKMVMVMMILQNPLEENLTAFA